MYLCCLYAFVSATKREKRVGYYKATRSAPVTSHILHTLMQWPSHRCTHIIPTLVLRVKCCIGSGNGEPRYHAIENAAAGSGILQTWRERSRRSALSIHRARLECSAGCSASACLSDNLSICMRTSREVGKHDSSANGCTDQSPRYETESLINASPNPIRGPRRHLMLIPDRGRSR